MNTWRTDVRSGRAHRVIDRKPECEAPGPPGGTTWGRTTRGHLRCSDCLRLEAGETMAEIYYERAHVEALAENEHRALNA